MPESRSTLIDRRPGGTESTIVRAPSPSGPTDGDRPGIPASQVIPPLLPNQVFERSRWQPRYAAKLRATDFVVVSVAVVLAHIVRFGPTLSPRSYPHYYVAGFSALFIVLWLVALAALHTRSPRCVGSGAEEYRRVIAASFCTFGVIAIVTLLCKLDIARGYLAVALPFGAVGLVLTRALWRVHMGRRRAAGECRTAILAIGEPDAVRHLATELTRDPAQGVRVVGVAIPGYGPGRGEHLVVEDRMIPVVGGEADALQAIRACRADTVAIAGTELFGVTGIRRLIWDLEPLGVDLVVSTGVMDVALSRLVMRPIAGLPLLHIEKPQYHRAKRFQKQAFDLCFALTALAVSAPVLLVATLAITLTSRGPVFYSSERIGIDGRPFTMLKLRTMVDNADSLRADLFEQNEGSGLLFKLHDDPRVTPVGRILRRFSIDELPQFINVLRREMSVVGPRPPLRSEVEAYDREVLRRLLVKPGITGLWQISGRSDLSWSDAVRLDLSYVDNWSMVGDVLIIVRTLGVVVKHTGAY